MGRAPSSNVVASTAKAARSAITVPTLGCDTPCPTGRRYAGAAWSWVRAPRSGVRARKAPLAASATTTRWRRAVRPNSCALWLAGNGTRRRHRRKRPLLRQQSPARRPWVKRLAAVRSAAPPAGRWRFSLTQDTKATRRAATIARCFVIALAARRPALSPPPLRCCRKRRAERTEDARTRSRSVSKGQRSTPASSQHGFTSSERSGSSAIALAEVNGAFKLCCAFICDKESAWRAAVATRWFVLANAAAALR